MDMCSDWVCVVMCVDVDPGLKSIHLAPGPGVDSSPSPDAGPSAPPRQHRLHRSGGTRDDRYRSGTTNTLTITITPCSHQQRHFASSCRKMFLSFSFYQLVSLVAPWTCDTTALATECSQSYPFHHSSGLPAEKWDILSNTTRTQIHSCRQTRHKTLAFHTRYFHAKIPVLLRMGASDISPVVPPVQKLWVRNKCPTIGLVGSRHITVNLCTMLKTVDSLTKNEWLKTALEFCQLHMWLLFPNPTQTFTITLILNNLLSLVTVIVTYRWTQIAAFETANF